MIATSWPIILEIYHKRYGIKELFYEELVESVKVQEEKVCVLGGEVHFRIREEGGEKTVQIPKPNKKELGLEERLKKKEE
jgi:hypothetical protein